MDDKGKIVSSRDIDDNLALQIWTKGNAPRLVLFNKVKNTRKLIHLSWVEKRDRKLSINGKKRGESTNYLVQDFEPAVQQILAEYAARTNFIRAKLLQFSLNFEKVVHSPELVTVKNEMTLLSEDKRCALWIADCTGPNKKVGVFRPFFPVTKAEAEAFTEERLQKGEAGRSADALIKSGVVSHLKSIRPERWHNPVRVTAAAMLLEFSFCGYDGSKFADALWDDNKNNPNNFSPVNTMGTTMKQPARAGAGFSLHNTGLLGFGHKLTAFMRHFGAAPHITSSISLDSDKELQDNGYARVRRVDMQPGSIGDVPYRVTFFENEETKKIAFGCIPQAATARHTGELIYTIPQNIYQSALAHDTLGGPEDEFFSITQLVWTKQFKDWYESVTPYIKSFIGLMGN
ncbi:MAG: hypothetical protein IJ667_10580 [Synergistaceae bacterium]|nr:hypothetical protein [Synergistaceae bacterium]